MNEKIITKILMLLALSAISILALITFFIFSEGLPLIFKTGLPNFLFGQTWAPMDGKFGILPMILGSFWITLEALVLGVPLAIGCAIFLVEFSPKIVTAFLKPAIELLAGIPSVVYGFLGMIVLAPLVRTYFGGPGLSVLTAGAVLAIMILPTIISISVDALQSVPKSFKEGSLALGATRWQTVRGVTIPAAKSGLVAAIILGIGRAVGETMAVIMVAGNATKIPTSLLDPARTLTSNIALEMGFAMGDHRRALFATGLILFVLIMALNSMVSFIVSRSTSK